MFHVKHWDFVRGGEFTRAMVSIDLRLGDCIDVMRTLPENSIHSIVCDPPYGLEFMGKEWDRLSAPTGGARFTEDGMGKGFKALPSFNGSPNPTCRNCKGTRRGNDRKGFTRCRCDNPDFPDSRGMQARSMQAWHEAWAVEALRVLRPGGHLLAFGGTRTYHRLACALEDAGFEIRDCLMWLYGTGFPKSLDISKAFDKAAGAERAIIGSAVYGDGHVQNSIESMGYQGNKPGADTSLVSAPTTDLARQWEGWGTALKPSVEPIVLARKPLIGTVIQNVQAYATGGLNIDGCRIEGIKGVPASPRRASQKAAYGDLSNDPGTGSGWQPNVGRWPANTILSHTDECTPVGAEQVKARVINRWDDGSKPFGGGAGHPYTTHALGDENGMETVEVWACSEGCPVRLLDEQSGNRPGCKSPSSARPQSKFRPSQGEYMPQGPIYGDNGGASRFFKVVAPIDEQEQTRFLYSAKANKKERNLGVEGVNGHPTVKPVSLMQWLVRLVCPPGGTVLDPFLGSGTTAIACLHEGFDCIGIEMNSEYLAIAEQRVAYWQDELSN